MFINRCNHIFDGILSILLFKKKFHFYKQYSNYFSEIIGTVLKIRGATDPSKLYSRIGGYSLLFTKWKKLFSGNLALEKTLYRKLIVSFSRDVSSITNNCATFYRSLSKPLWMENRWTGLRVFQNHKISVKISNNCFHTLFRIENNVGMCSCVWYSKFGIRWKYYFFSTSPISINAFASNAEI